MNEENIDYLGIENRIVNLNTSKRLPIIVIVDPTVKRSGNKEIIKKSVENAYNQILSSRGFANSVEFSIVCGSGKKKAVQKLCEIRTQSVLDYEYDFDENRSIRTALQDAIYQWEGRKRVLEGSVPKVKYYSPIFIIFSEGNIEKRSVTDTARIEHSELAKEIEYIHNLVEENKLAVFSMVFGDGGEQHLLQKLTGLESGKHLRRIEDEYSLANLCQIVMCRLLNDAYPVVPKLSSMFFN